MSAPGERAVSVVVPTYNADEHLEACLSSLDEAEEPEGGTEVLVADGGSTDRTLAIARDHDARVLELPESSVAQARNEAVAKARGDVVVFVDADCKAPPEILTVAVQRLQEHAVVGAFYEPAAEHGWVARTWLSIEAKPEGEVAWVPAGTMAVRREAFAGVGGFDEQLRASEDVDLCRRLRRADHTIYHEPAMACVHLGQADTLSAFFSKEVWRAQSLVASVRSSGELDGEAVTALLAVFHLVWPVLFVASGWLGWFGLAGALVLGVAPTLGWTILASARAGWAWFPQVWVLVVVYNAARAWSLVEHRQYRDLFG